MITADQIVRAALEWEGTPYRHQCALQGAGCDCLGLLRGVWAQLLGSEPFLVPPYSADPRHETDPGLMLREFNHWLMSKAKPAKAGDVLLFSLSARFPPHHCAIMLDGEQFLHAQERLGVVRGALPGPWLRRLHSVYQLPVAS